MTWPVHTTPESKRECKVLVLEARAPLSLVPDQPGEPYTHSTLKTLNADYRRLN
jgi:hypothetical protein